ncbi:TetR/AcrR family transcriptional regulator [Aquibacillus rhizosphaerae]|uniref:TetR/AcrR family transcriptional regulator n=1 Tax=Aquibacillus rhizosphaerae TaxID=3051431 RepID=A0ABT7LAU5_9BACI|nr:TetR/AcrR family transcriptional regulator [Aquibacillus sp. LR5S19]MDL4842984.1 TetR/AcrR family transcriptional regulator [Aquibacillus sp. LR5S19]
MKEKKSRSLGRPRASELKQPTNELILSMATQLFLTNGYQEVSVDDVAKKCNITKATVYYYYESKAELFTETIVQMMFRIREHMQTMLLEDSPLRDRLLKVAVAHLKATVDLDLDGFMRETKNVLSSEQIKKMQEAEENMYRAIEKAFEAAIENGEITKINPTFAAHSYVSLLKVGNYRDAENNAIFSSIEETADQIVRLFWNGLFPNQ